MLNKKSAPFTMPRLLTLSVTGLCLTWVGCGTSGITPSGDAIPVWARQATRTVDGGFIVYVESDDDAAQDRAKFRAESAALADLQNECTMIPKGVRIEDRFTHKVGHLFQSYAKVGLEMQLCDEAKRANDPESIRKLGNAAMAQQVKTYQEQIGQTEDVVASAEQGGQPEGSEAAPQIPVASNGSPAGNSGQPAPVRVFVRDDEHFYVIREQVAMAKQQVVLAPATAYQPQSPEYQRFTQTVPAQSQAVAQYEAANPAVKATPHAWSFYRHQIMRPKIDTGEVLKPRPKVRPLPGTAPAKPAAAPKKKRRRREDN